MVPTCSEILKVLLSVSNLPTTSRTSSRRRTLTSSVPDGVQLHLPQILLRGPRSLMIALDILGYQNFKHGIISIVEENQISFDVGEFSSVKPPLFTTSYKTKKRR